MSSIVKVTNVYLKWWNMLAFITVLTACQSGQPVLDSEAVFSLQLNTAPLSAAKFTVVYDADETSFSGLVAPDETVLAVAQDDAKGEIFIAILGLEPIEGTLIEVVFRGRSAETLQVSDFQAFDQAGEPIIAGISSSIRSLSELPELYQLQHRAILADRQGQGSAVQVAPFPELDASFADFDLGDVNADGVVDMRDVQFVRSLATGPQRGQSPSAFQLYHSDLDSSGAIDVQDLVALLMKVNPPLQPAALQVAPSAITLGEGDEAIILLGNSGNFPLPEITFSTPPGVMLTDVSSEHAVGKAYRVSFSPGAESGIIEFDAGPAGRKQVSLSLPIVSGEVNTLQVTPPSMLLSEDDQQQTLTVRAFDVNGREVSTDSLDFEWVSSKPNEISLESLGNTATVSAQVPLGSSEITVLLRSNPDVAAPPVSVIDARVHEDVELIGDSKIVFPLVNVPPGSAPEQLPDITVVGSQLMIGSFTEQEVGNLYEYDPLANELFYPVVLRGEAPAPGTPLLASEGGLFAGVVVRRESRDGFSLVQLRPASPTSIFHDLKVAYTAGRALEVDVAHLAQIPLQQSGTLRQQSLQGIIDTCSIDGNVGNVFTFTPTFTLETIIDGVLEIKDGDPVPDRFMMLVVVNAELSLEAGLELGGTLQGQIECELNLAEWDFPFPGYLAPFLSARVALDSVSSVTLEVIDGPHLSSTAGATLSGSVLVGFDYLSNQVVDLSDFASPSVTLNEPIFEGNPGFDSGVVDFRLGSYLRVTPGVVIGGTPAKVLKDLAKALPSGSGMFGYLMEKAKEAIDLTFFDMAEVKFGPELKATWMGNLAVLDNRESSSYGGSNFLATAAIKSDTLSTIASYMGLSELPQLEFPTIEIPGMSFFRPFAPGSIEVISNTHSGPVGEGEVIAVRAGETISVIASGEYTFALAPLVDAPLEYGEIWLNHQELLDDLPVGLGNMLAGPITITEDICGEGPFTLAILGYNRMFTVATAGYMGTITLECQEAGVALSPKDLWFGAQVKESVEASFTLTNLDEAGGDAVHYEILTNGDWLSLGGAAVGVIAAGDSVTLGMSGLCPDEPTFLAGSFSFTFIREDADGNLYPLTDNVPSDLPVFLQCFKEKEKDDDDEDDMGEGTTFGDPWLITPDGYHYGFQAVGDYILVKSTEMSDPFEVQARFQPFPGHWSGNAALAIRVLNSTVNIYANADESFEVYIDGSFVSEGAYELSGGGSVAFAGTRATVTWPDLTQVTIVLHRETLGAVTVVLPPSRRGKVEGLLGNFDGDPDNDIQIRNGEVLVDPSDEELYQDYRWSWRVPFGSDESLFWYGPDYWDPLFPTNIVRLEDLDFEAVRWAAEICTQVGIVDQNVLRSCIFDVAVTGDEGWATVAAGVDPSILGVNVTPQLSYLVTGGSRQFGAVVSGTSNREIVWSATGGTITQDTPNIMTYRAPLVPGEYEITARLAEDGSIEQTVTVIVVEPSEVDLDVSRVLAAGASHNLTVTEEGSVLAWGRNLRGQLGDGTTMNRSLPVEVEQLQGVRAVAAGFAFSLALKQDGTVWAWGDNWRGQLGTGNTTTSHTPVQVENLEGVTMIAAGAETSFALKSDGTLWAWGDNYWGQLGVDVSGDQVLYPAQVLNLSGVIALAASYEHTLALTNTGRVWAWGSNWSGELGNGTTLPSSVPQEIKTLDGIIAIAAGYQFSMALRADGTVWVWGSNWDGRLGTGGTGDAYVPTQISELSDVMAIAAGDNFRLALKQDGTVWGWGVNGWGQLGNGSNAPSSLPVQVANIDDAKAIVAGGSHSFAIREDGVVWGWGLNTSGQLGNGSDGSGNRYFWPSPVYLDRTTDLDQVIALGAGMALREDGSLWSWGANTRGELGVGHSLNSNVALQTLNLRNPVAIDSGNLHSLALLEDGTVWAWGSEVYGQLGNGVSGTNIHRSVPLQVHNLTDIVSIAAGGGFNLALKRDGTVWSWGWNANGELGIGNTTQQSLPVQVKGPEGEGYLSGVVAIAAGNTRSFAITEDGTLWAWGIRATGREDGLETSSSVPVEATRLPDDINLLEDLIAFSHASNHSLTLMQDGSVWAWGDNGRGQLGDGTTTGKRQAVRVRLSSDELLEDAVGIATGQWHSLAIREDGSLWSWGFNHRGQLGSGVTDGSINAFPGPVLNLSGVQSVKAASDTSFALLEDGTVWAWGQGISGQLGNGALEESNVPVQVFARVPLTVSLLDGEFSSAILPSTNGASEPFKQPEARRYANHRAEHNAALQVTPHISNPATLQVNEGDTDVVVLHSLLHAPTDSGSVTLRSITLDTLVTAASHANPANILSGVNVYLSNDLQAVHPVGRPLTTARMFDATGSVTIQLDRPIQLQAGETVSLIVTYDILRRTSVLPETSIPLLALLLFSPLLFLNRKWRAWNRSRTLLFGVLLTVMLAACTQNQNTNPPASRQINAVLTGIEITMQEAVSTVTGLPIQGAVVTVKP